MIEQTTGGYRCPTCGTTVPPNVEHTHYGGLSGFTVANVLTVRCTHLFVGAYPESHVPEHHRNATKAASSFAEALRRAHETATPGPWRSSGVEVIAPSLSPVLRNARTYQDADLTTLLRNAAPGLIDLVEAAERLSQATGPVVYVGRERAEAIRAVVDAVNALNQGAADD